MTASNRQATRNVVNGGYNLLRNQIQDIFNMNGSYTAIEVELSYLQFRMSDGEVAELVYGNHNPNLTPEQNRANNNNSYVLKRIQTTGGWITP